MGTLRKSEKVQFASFASVPGSAKVCGLPLGAG
jgi:hypothetical protein